MGTLLRDYHTTQVPSSKRGIVHYTRRSELAVDELNTILSSRDYRCDAVYTVAVAIREDSGYTAKSLANALTKPVFTLYLGRKSCPLSLPLQPKTISKANLKEALGSVVFDDHELDGIPKQSHALIYWEEGQESGYTHEQIITRRDAPLNRIRWQFGERKEYFCTIKKEDASCSSV